MTQIIFGPNLTPQETDLDANFAAVFDLRELITTSGYAAATPKWYMDAAGNFGLGVAPSAWVSTAKALDGPSGALAFSSTSGVFLTQNLYLNASSNWIYKNNGFGSLLGMSGGGFQLYGVASSTAGATATLVNLLTIDSVGNGAAGTDNAQTWGTAAKRWSVIYAGTGSINTSDAREKTAVTPLTASEIAAAMDLASSIGTYQWLSAIQAKGEGDARRHIGMTVQSAISVMTSHGLDPMAYGFICYDSWPDQRDEHGNVTLAAGDRYSFRPDEFGMFIARGVAASLASISARLTAGNL